MLKREYAIKGMHGTYYRQMTGIGPMFGGTVKTAWRATTRVQADAEESKFPALASVGCRVVELAPLKSKKNEEVSR